MFVQLTPPSMEDSQLVMVPDSPVRSIVPLLSPEQAAYAAGERVPPTETGNTVMIASKEFVAGHCPF